MMTAMVRTVQLFTQMANGMMFHVSDIHMDLFVKLVSMLMLPPESDDQIAQWLYCYFPMHTYFNFPQF